MKAYDQGAVFRVTVSAQEVADFASRWPCSGLPDRGVSFTFDRNGLVDIHPASLDGEAAAALADDAQAYGRKQLNR